MSAPFTPGPWVRCHGPLADVRAGDPYTGKKIANTMFAELKGTTAEHRAAYDKRLDECRANADLIAAAPELLEALEEVLRDRGANLADETRYKTPAEIAAFAIIAKARGEA